MIGYVTIGTNDLERGAAFYDTLLADLGASRLMEFPHAILWGRPGQCMLGIIKPHDGGQANPGNGMMSAIACESPEQVTAVYNKALELGGTDEGEPGPRGDGGAFFAYFRDLDGNKLAAFHMGG